MDRQTLVGPAAPPREPESLTKLEPRRVLANVVVCAGLLFALAVVAAAFVYVIMGCVILSKYSDIAGGECCDHEHIWIYTLLCIVGFATFFCCGICQGVNIEDEDKNGGRYQPGMFLVLSSIVSFGSFVWGSIEYGQMKGACKSKFGDAYPGLWLFFRVSVILQIFGAIFQFAFFFFLCWASFRRQLKVAQRQILIEAKDNIHTIPGGEKVTDVVVGVNSAIADTIITAGGGVGVGDEETVGYVDISHGSIQTQSQVVQMW